MQQHTDPTSNQHRYATRLLLALVIILSLTSGYLAIALRFERLRFERYEDMFVRVRTQIGRDAMQQLIDQSYEGDQSELIDW